MRDLRLRLGDDLQFDEMAEIARSLIPTLAPRWTDHNVHDPGIMLTELVAWIADAQIYSLSRGRRDERRAYARLMGLEAEGPTAAEGYLWPDRALASDPARAVPWARGTVLDARHACSVTHSDAPAFRPATPIYLTTCKLTRLLARAEDGAQTDLTRLNESGAAEFLPFGAAPGPEACLRLEFAGGAAASPVPASRGAPLSIGVEVAGAPAAPLPVTHATRLRARLMDAQGAHDLAIVADHTGLFTRTGVLLLDVDPRAMGVDDAFAIELRCPSGRWLVTPRITRIGANVIPLRQAERLEWVDVGLGQGVPDQRLKLPMPGLQFGGSHRVAVRAFEQAAWQEWQPVDGFDESGPDDRHVHVDVARGELRFGNGLNGRQLENGAPVQASYDVTAGLRGNLPANMLWRVGGIAGVYGANPAAMTGGRDAHGDLDLQIAARTLLEESRPIVSSRDLEAAALGFTDLRVSRAHELPPVAGRRVAGERRLLVLGDHRDDVAAEEHEPWSWRQEIQSRLAPRLPAGQKLVVVAPRYVAVTVRARLVAQPRLDVREVAARLGEHLAQRFALLPSPGAAGWPLGRNVSRMTVSGWLRKFTGIARVLELELMADGRSVSEIEIPATALPLLRLSPGDVDVVRPGSER